MRQKKDTQRTIARAVNGAEDESLPLCGKASRRRYAFALSKVTLCGRRSHDLVIIHECERLGFCAKKKGHRFGVLFLAQKTRFELVLRFSHTTPLAGEPLEPLGYFCNSSISSFLFKSYTTIPHFFGIVKAFCLENMKNFLFLFFPLHLPYYKTFLIKYSQILDGFFTIVYNVIVKKYFYMECICHESNHYRKL